MPSRAPVPCKYPGCGKLTSSGYCDVHALKVKRDKNQAGRRWEQTNKLYNARWRKLRSIFLADNPLCVACKSSGRITEATVVDHIEPHKGDELRFWDERNWQPLCKPCHDAKTAREDGGFGNAGRGRTEGGEKS